MTEDTATVVPLFEGVNPEVEGPDKDMIAALEHALDRARKGEFLAMAVVGVLPHGHGLYRNWSIGHGQRLALQGAVSILHASLTERYFETTTAIEFDPVRDEQTPPDTGA